MMKLTVTTPYNTPRRVDRDEVVLTVSRHEETADILFFEGDFYEAQGVARGYEDRDVKYRRLEAVVFLEKNEEVTI